MFAGNGDTLSLIDQGWAQLIKDNDAQALKLFGKALEHATLNNDTREKANALLYMAICTYGSSLNEGLDYCLRSMDEFKKLNKSDPAKALSGRSKCLQLLSTIYGRQGKYREAIHLGKEALDGFEGNLSDRDKTYPGLIYNTLGSIYNKLNKPDSSAFFFRKSLDERVRNNDLVYLPSAYCSVAELELKSGNKQRSAGLYQQALQISKMTENRQAIVLVLCGMATWAFKYDKPDESERLLLEAESVAKSLTDRSFYIKTLSELVQLKKQTGDYKTAQKYQETIAIVKDSMNVSDNAKLIEKLKVQFEVSEMDRKLTLVQKEKELVRLTNILLWGALGILLLIGIVIILLQKRINSRDKLLLQANESLMTAMQSKKALEEKQLKNEIEFKESQLTAMTLQMVQKNELMQELQDKITSVPGKKDDGLQKIINKGLNHDREWSDFNTHFESINKNFYSKLKEAYPDISANDLKICALIRLNLSIKEMSGILNISPDSVKTARYRLRKKIGLNTEDSLSGFILSI